MPRFLNRLVLTPPDGNPNEPRLDPTLDGGELSELEQNYALLNQQGTAMSVLRPAGKAQIGDRFVDVVSEGAYITKGSQIEVIDVQGNKIVVRTM